MQRIFINKEGSSTFVGLMIPFGSYYESSHDKGIAHFIEHLLFKGTPTRSRSDIDRAIEGKGGDLNAFTDTELTVYHCRVANKHKNEAIEILTDMVCNPLFPVKEIDKEREVILQELKMYKDHPSAIVEDIRNDIFYPKGNGFNVPVIGTEESLNNIKREDIVRVHEEQYNNPILIVVGDVQDDIFLTDYNMPTTHSQSFYKKRIEHLVKRPNLEQSRVLISNEIMLKGFTNRESLVLQQILSAVYNDMSGRLFNVIREEHHLVYGVHFGVSQRSSGMAEWQVSLGLDADKIQKARKLVEEELTRPVYKKELQFALEKAIGSIALNFDNAQNIGEFVSYCSRKQIDWEVFIDEFEFNARLYAPMVNKFIKKMNFKQNVLVGLVPK